MPESNRISELSLNSVIASLRNAAVFLTAAWACFGSLPADEPKTDEVLSGTAAEYASFGKQFEHNAKQISTSVQSLEKLRSGINNAIQQQQIIGTARQIQQIQAAMRLTEYAEFIDTPIFSPRTLRPTADALQRQYTIAATQLSQIRFAGDVTSERLRSMSQEFVRLSNQLQLLSQAQVKLVGAYIYGSDTFTAETREENQATLAVLEEASDENVGAQLVRAIVLRRLGVTKEAKQILKKQQEQRNQFLPLITAMLVEHTAAMDDEFEPVKALLPITQSGNVAPLVHVFAARAHLKHNDYPAAIRHFRKASDEKTCEGLVNRDFALAMIQNEKATRRDRLEAMTLAKLAVKRSDDSQWNDQLAYAIVLAANGEFQGAEVQAQAAANTASDEFKPFCDGILVSIQQGSLPQWDFKQF